MKVKELLEEIKLLEMDKKEYCCGCRDSFYKGNNPYGIKECWSFKDAKVVSKKEVPVTQVPPWKQKPKKVLSCYHRDGYVYVGPDKTC